MGNGLKPSRFTEQQIIGILREQEGWGKMATSAASTGISSADFLQMEGQVRRPGGVSGAVLERWRRERQAEETVARRCSTMRCLKDVTSKK